MSTGVYTKTFGEVIRNALRDSGIVAVERPITSNHFTLAQSKGNDVLAAWQGLNIHLWSETEALLPLVSGQNEYTLGVGGDHCFTDYVYATASSAILSGAVVIPCSTTTGMTIGDNIGIKLSTNVRQWATISSISAGVSVTIGTPLSASVESGASIYTYTNKIDRPVRILQARGAPNNTGDEKELRMETREGYYRIVKKSDSSSDVNSWYYSPQLTIGKLSIWQTPNNCDQIMRFTFVKPQYVNQDQTETVLIPAEWLLAFKWAVAYQLGITYNIDPNRLTFISNAARDALNTALSNDEEYDSFNFQPE